MADDEGSGLLLPGEVAKLFRVDPVTVSRWAKSGRLPSIVLPSGHHRFRRADIRRIMEGEAVSRGGAEG